MMTTRGKAAEQLSEYTARTRMYDQMTTSSGSPIGNKLASLTAGARGPMLIPDFVYTDEMAHFGRERIPERVVHAKGAGAFGYFECTNDITKYTKMAPFKEVGKKTKVAVRFSTVGGESGSADTVRDVRGFAVKFYTEEGNWDLVGISTPVFFIRDPILFPSLIHSQKRNPKTHLKDPDMFWDFISLRPETTHQVAFLFSDRGTPDGYRHMNGYGNHAFKLVSADDARFYCKFHFKTDQGIKNLSPEKSTELAGTDPDYATRDLYNAIEDNFFPKWRVYIQVMTFEQAETLTWNPFDVTKIWPHGDYPLIHVGQLVLDRNPRNYFAEVEELAFCPAHFIPGIEASPDKVLQGRLFSYVDALRHRLGTNFTQIPVNVPNNSVVKNYQRDGPQCVTDNQGDAPNYYPNSFGGPEDNPKYDESKYSVFGQATRYDTRDEDNFSQVTQFWNYVLNDAERERLVQNIASSLKDAKDFIQDRAIYNFFQADPMFGQRVKEAIEDQKQKAIHIVCKVSYQ